MTSESEKTMKLVTNLDRKAIEGKLAEVRELEERSQAEAFAQRLTQLDISIARRVGENNTLYGSVTSGDVAQALHAKGFEIDKRKITLVDPLKALGEYAKSQRLGLRHCFLGRGAVRQNTRQFRHFRQPAPVLFPLVLDGEMHGQHLYSCRDSTPASTLPPNEQDRIRRAAA